MPTHCKPVSLAFQGCQGRRVTAAFDGGSITSNAGALLLRKADRSTGLFNRVAAGFTDHRDPRLTEHSVRTLVAQRITGITLGYEDLNDHDDLRHDPLLALLSGKIEARRKDCAPLAGKSTLSRLEHAPAGGKPSRYAKIDHDPEKLQDVLAESFIDSWQGLPPSRLVLDIDSTDDEVHGRQEGRSFHGYYNHYCFLPLYITCGGRPLFALLRPGSADPAGGVTGPLGRIVARLRQEWPWLKILLRADSAYALETPRRQPPGSARRGSRRTLPVSGPGPLTAPGVWPGGGLRVAIPARPRGPGERPVSPRRFCYRMRRCRMGRWSVPPSRAAVVVEARVSMSPAVSLRVSGPASAAQGTAVPPPGPTTSSSSAALYSAAAPCTDTPELAAAR